MNIQKLPSGNYRIRQMVNGKSYSVTLDHRPTQIEAMKIVSELTAHAPKKGEYTVVSACDAYINAKTNVLSPSTIRNYRGQIRAISDDFKGVYIKAVTSAMLQTEVNRYAKDHQPKTVSNFAHFLTAVFLFHDIELRPPKLPQAVKRQPYLPTVSEVRAIVREVKGTKYEVFYRLALYGLRRSEIFALTMDDLSDDNLLTINKAMVLNDKREKVIKTTKTTASTRTIRIGDRLADIIRKQGYVWEGSFDMPYIRLCQVQDKLGIQHFPLHAFRHECASVLHYEGVPDKNIQGVCGWETDYVMKERYRQEVNADAVRDQVSDIIESTFDTDFDTEE